MSFLELLASFSPAKVLSDWRHENTVREQNRQQAEIERQRMEAAHEEELRKIELERIRIENADKQQQRQTQLEEKKECLKFVTENHLSKTISKEMVVSLLSAETLQEHKSLPPALANNGSQVTASETNLIEPPKMTRINYSKE